MSLVSLNSITAEASSSAPFSCAHTASTTHTANTATAKRAHKHVWPAATKSAFYANFYAVDEATGAMIG
jgi:hypothetical protein